MRRASRGQPSEGQQAHVRQDRKGRGGKIVTVVYNLHLAPDRLKELGKQLRQVCGTGGTVKEGTIEIQGDHQERVTEALQAAGYRTKFTGG